MIFFFYLQTPFTHGEDGIQSVPRGKLFGFIDLSNTLVMYYVVLAIFLVAFLFIYRDRAFAVRPGAEGDPRKRAARDLAGLRRRAVQAPRVRAVGRAVRSRRIRPRRSCSSWRRLTDVHWTMSGEVVLMTLLGGMGTIFGPVVGAFAIIGLESYLASFGQWVTVITGRDLRRVRACVPARHRRRAWRMVGEPQRLRRRAGARRRGELRAARARGGAGPGRSKAAAATGQPHGAYELRSPGGQVRVVGAFNRGKRTGSFLFWSSRRRAHRAAAVRRRRRCPGRSRCGTRPASRAAEPSPKLEAVYAHGRLSGVKRSWYPDGRLRAEMRYDARRCWSRRARTAKRESRCPTPRPARSRRATSRPTSSSMRRWIRSFAPTCRVANRRPTGLKRASESPHRRGAGAPLKCDHRRCFDALR